MKLVTLFTALAMLTASYFSNQEKKQQKKGKR